MTRAVAILFLFALACAAPYSPPVVLRQQDRMVDTADMSPAVRARMRLPPCTDPAKIARARNADSTQLPILLRIMLFPPPPPAIPRPVIVVVRGRVDSIGRIIPAETVVNGPTAFGYGEKLADMLTQVRFTPGADLEGTCAVSGAFRLSYRVGRQP